MTDLRLNLLGDLEVLRDGAAMPLPPSKKTRALLAYLALNDRPFRREHLCELLWEVPDDPRGSLRWSLSKLRRLVDDAQRPRIQADRLQVSLDTSDMFIDVVALHDIAREPAGASIQDLEGAIALYRGNLVEGLDLSTFYDFHTWCVGQRERAAQSFAVILRVLIDRLAAEPERALLHARTLVGIDPYDEAARAALIRRLVALRRTDEAQQQYQLGKRLLKEIGVDATDVLYRALHGAPGSRPGGVDAPIASVPPVVASPSSDGALIGRDVDFRYCAMRTRP